MGFLGTLRSSLQRHPGKVIASPKRASVAAIFRHSPVQPDKVQLLYIRRKVNPHDTWSGHMAFPGGRMNDGETELAAAIRETHEEIGLTLNESHVVGRIDDRPVYYGRTVATSHVFLLGHNEAFNPVLQAKEVSDVLWVDVDFLLSTPIQTLQIPTKYIFPKMTDIPDTIGQSKRTTLENMTHIDFPCIYLNRPDGHVHEYADDAAAAAAVRPVHDFVLWGLTYNMTSDILKAGGHNPLPSMSAAVRSIRDAIFHAGLGKSKL
ncbi:hypothetical protein H310_03333 [Aphanomyces invadans]|uniref:Nudix hydrolase domain-containing protein n=1 Tax=Aphanomyces invadans TaxID=157072 RepID=A0A024UH14_9STRA|nr:hypothetical protein H310_03333 [Aphanomyces invadans]ETW05589.1 hypothetical protein H310_03333 [Aphanomyces invadans]|eukprot:XP_008865366.1 hypothetical protein H310_03333 [Aphanomyces invadans]